MLRSFSTKTTSFSATAARMQRMTPLARRRWMSGTPEEQDIVVIGGGPGGYVAAIKAGQLGFKVTCVEKRGRLGGTCLNVGCIPSKALLHSSHMYHEAAHNFEMHGIDADNVRLNLGNMMKRKEKAVDGLTSGIEFLFKKNKVNYAKGVGQLTGANEVTVTGEDGSTQVIPAKNVIIATGSDVMSLPGIEIDEERIVSSTGALSLKEVPKKMVVIGGGVIGLELGSVWSRLGAEVTVVEFMDAIAAGADKDVARELQKVLKKQGLKFQLKTKVTSAKNTGNGVTLEVESTDGKKKEKIEADVVLVSVGRRAYTDSLGLKDVGVKVDEAGRVEINDHFVTNVPSVRAIGDVVRGAMLAHKAEEEGIAAVENIVNPSAGHVTYGAIPSVIYTHPEVAWVGETEQDLKARGAEVNIGKFNMKANSRARTNDDADGFVKILSDKHTDQVYGVHIVSAGAGELIAEATLAIEYGGSSEDIARTCHAHPTLSEAVKEAALDVYDKPIHQ